MQARDVIFPPGATDRDWVLDGALAAVLGVAQLGSRWILGAGYAPDTAWSTFVCLAMIASLVCRRHAPLLALGLATLFGIAHLSTLNHPTFSLVAVPIVAYAVARWVPGLESRSVLVIGLGASLIGPYRWFWDAGGYLREEPRNGVLFFTFVCLCFGAVATPYIIGRRVLEGEDARVRELEAERERSAAAAIEREQQARIAEGSMRAMIARELHDVVAHSLSIMIVQAEGGRALARKNPDAAATALDTIAGVGRESLTEMRRIVGVLRGGPDAQAGAADYHPAPTLADVPGLVRRTTDRADLRVEGTPQGTTPALELTLYRIVQEALTNVLKHAGPDARARVSLHYSPTRVTAEIVDNGRGFDADSTGGNGLLGMRERVAAMGGDLTAGPLPAGAGFRVYATLPVRATPNDSRSDTEPHEGATA